MADPGRRPPTSVTFRVPAGRRDLVFGEAGLVTLRAGVAYDGPKELPHEGPAAHLPVERPALMPPA